MSRVSTRVVEDDQDVEEQEEPSSSSPLRKKKKYSSLFEYSQQDIHDMDEEQLNAFCLRLGVEREQDEEREALTQRLLARQAAPDEWSPAVSVWSVEVLTSLNENALHNLKQQQGLEEETSLQDMVHWANVVMAVNNEFIRAIRTTQNLLEEQRFAEFVEDHDQQALVALLQDLKEGGCWTADAMQEKLQSGGVVQFVLSTVLKGNEDRWLPLQQAANAEAREERRKQELLWSQQQLKSVSMLGIDLTSRKGDDEEAQTAVLQVQTSARQLLNRPPPRRVATTTPKKRKATSTKKKPVRKTRKKKKSDKGKEEEEQEEEEHEEEQEEEGEQKQPLEEQEEFDELLQNMQRSLDVVVQLLKDDWEDEEHVSIDLSFPELEPDVDDAVAALKDAADEAEVVNAFQVSQLKQWWTVVRRAFAVAALMNEVKTSKRKKTKVEVAWASTIRKNGVSEQRYSYDQAQRYVRLAAFLRKYPAFMFQVEVRTVTDWAEKTYTRVGAQRGSNLCKVVEEELDEDQKQAWSRSWEQLKE